jgi:hypothetical protein
LSDPASIAFWSGTWMVTRAALELLRWTGMSPLAPIVTIGKIMVVPIAGGDG